MTMSQTNCYTALSLITGCFGLYKHGWKCVICLYYNQMCSQSSRRHIAVKILVREGWLVSAARFLNTWKHLPDDIHRVVSSNITRQFSLSVARKLD